MINAIERILERIENATAPFWMWCLGFAGIFYVRFFLEVLSSTPPEFPAPDAITTIHYALFFIGSFLSLALILRIFVKDIGKASKFLLFGFPIIWLAPILDLIHAHGAASEMGYIFTANWREIFQALLNMGYTNQLSGATYGIRSELIAIAIGAGLYVWFKTKNVLKAIGALILSYLALFTWFLAPGILAFATSGQQWSSATITSYLLTLFGNSHLLQNSVSPSMVLSSLQGFETLFNLGMSVVLYLVDLLLVVVWAILYNKKFVVALLKNSRPARMGYYLGLVVMGMLGAARAGVLPPFVNIIDVFIFATLLIAFFLAFMFAIGTNDIADINIDRATNNKRPLPAGTMNASDLSNANAFFLSWALLGAFIAGYWTFFTVAVFTFAYYIYSVPPLRLKRVPLLSSFLVSIASLCALMAGFFFADQNKFLSDLPMAFVALILICITLAVNFKDIKDIEGDKAEEIWTIPVLFGESVGKQIVGALLAISFLAVPVILRDGALFWPSLAAALFAYIICVAKKYREWRIFIVYFIYIAAVGAILWVHPIFLPH